MKIIGYTKYDLKDNDKITKKNGMIEEERKKFPNRYPKRLSETYWIGTSKFFRLYEGTEEQFANMAARWIPEMKWYFASIFTTSDWEEAAKRIK